MLNKVPEVTLFFWIIKIMCTTVGETAADYLNVNLGFGPRPTYVDRRAARRSCCRPVPPSSLRFRVYWSVVVVISVFGTLITDDLTDRYDVPLTTTTTPDLRGDPRRRCFARLVHPFERTLSIHSIVTTRRELFYWLAILFTFALGTAAGDLTAEKLDLGYARLDRPS